MWYMYGCTEAASLGASLDANPQLLAAWNSYQTVLCLLNAPRRQLHRENYNFCQDTGNPCMTTHGLWPRVKLLNLQNPPGATWSLPLCWTSGGRKGRLGCSHHSSNSQSLFPASTGAVQSSLKWQEVCGAYCPSNALRNHNAPPSLEKNKGCGCSTDQMHTSSLL